jgi:N-acetylglucosaminyldiphosphoundecaprenol N-acetyl-beta-D-mannosaminyltransferase
MQSPPRFNVLGVGVHALNLALASEQVIAAARTLSPSYVCFCDVNNVSCAERDPHHRAILNHSLLTTPDGMPLVWLGKCAGHKTIGRVYGPDLMLEVCRATAGTELTHFFYGGGPGTAESLAANLQARFPGLNVAGAQCPPFRMLTVEEAGALEKRIHATQPNFFWVGLSTPKQEAFMAEYSPRLGVPVMLGVGAAFDFISGRITQAPRWVQRSGFEWFWRLCAEPRRLAPRYFKNNPLFLVRALAQLTGLKKYPTDFS